MDFPYSIFVWHPPRRLTNKPFWEEGLRANTQQMAIYAAGLLYNAGVPHQDTVRERPVVKVVRQGKTLLASLLGSWLKRRSPAAKLISWLTGSVLVVLGVRLAFSGRK